MIAAALLVLVASAPPPQADPVVLVADGIEITRSAYADWLLRARGELYAPNYVRLWHLRRQGAQLGLSFDAEHCRELAEREIERRIGGAFGGDRERWLVELEREGRSPAGWIAQRAIGLEGEQLLAALEKKTGRTQRVLLAEANRPFEFHFENLGAKDGATPVLSIDDGSVTLDEYRGWLLNAFGEIDARRRAESLCLERVTRAADITVTSSEVEARNLSDLAVVIEHDYHGERDRWLEELRLTGRSEAQFLREFAFRKRDELLLERLILAERVVSEAELRAAWVERFGPEGRRIELRWIRLDAETPAALEGAVAEAGTLQQRIRAGEDFATLVKKHSDDPTTRARGGRPPKGFLLLHLPEPLVDPVRALGAGEVSEPLVHEGSVWLFEVTAVRVTPFEEARADLFEELRSRRPTEVELAARRTALVRDIDVRVLPALFAD